MTEEDKLKKLQDLNSSILKSQPLKRFSESIAKNFNLSEHLALPYLNSELLMNQTKAFMKIKFLQETWLFVPRRGQAKI